MYERTFELSEYVIKGLKLLAIQLNMSEEALVNDAIHRKMIECLSGSHRRICGSEERDEFKELLWHITHKESKQWDNEEYEAFMAKEID